MRAERRKTDPKTGKHTVCEPAQSKHTWTCHKSHFVLKFTGKMPGPNPARAILCGNLQERCRTPIPQHQFRASLRSRNAQGHFTRTILCGNFKVNCRTQIPQRTFCARLRDRSAHGHFTRAIFAVIYRKNAAHYSTHLD